MAITVPAMSDTTEPNLLQELTSRTRGAVHVPGTDDYERTRVGMQLLAEHRPEVVIEAANAEDIQAAVQTAARFGVAVAAHRTGHGQGSGIQRGVLVHTRNMVEVRPDPDRRTAWVAAGARWQEVIDAAAPHGLAPLSGSSADVGAVSYTLGGGVGLLARRFGFAADHVRRVDLVTGQGELREVTASTDPELFWAVRGAGCSLGLVTGMEIDLFPVPRLFGGSLYLDATETPEVLESWRQWTQTVPEEMTSGVSILTYPDMDGVPEPMRGRLIAQLSVSWSGEPEQGPALVEPLRAVAPVVMDTLGELSYADSGRIFDEHHDQAGFAGRSVLVDDLPADASTELVRRLAEPAPFLRVVGLRHLGGALAREPHFANALGHRAAEYSISVLTFADPAAPVDTAQMRAFRAEAAGLFAAQARGRSATLAFGPQTPAEVREAFEPEDHRRLVALRTELDPQGVLHSHRPLE